MEEIKDNESIENEEIIEDDFELSHSDKLVGVITEPGNTFSAISKFPAKTADWIIPLLIMVVVAALSQVVMMSNDAIKYSMLDKQMEAIEKQLDDAVEKGQMTEAQKEERLDQTRQFMENSGMSTIFSVIGIVVFTFIFFFIIAGVWFIVSKFILKGDGTFADAMVAYGLPYYIVILQLIVMVIAALVMNKMMAGTSIADFFGVDKTNIGGFILAKLDPFSIWFYSVISIGLAKMFKSENTAKFFAVVFGLWLSVNFLLFFLSKMSPFFGNFIR